MSKHSTHPHLRRRRPTRRVLVGDVGIGGDEPIRVQSMTTTLTGDTEATAAQTRALADAGCEIVRVTVPKMSDAHSLEAFRRRLETDGITVPIVADIHFNPSAAMVAADYVQKVRVNPGNYADSKRFAVREYTDDEYAAELDRVREKFTPLVEKCKRLGVAMRIGTNHGSLSDRIMNRHGDSPLGMVESALEFVRICEELDYHDIVLSMKSSNPIVAIQAYRLLADRMTAEDMDYPFHLGVTEAGDGEDARIKSAIGIGSLLADGIGDTVRVSLTEDPCREVPVAFALVKPFNERAGEPAADESAVAVVTDPRDPHDSVRRPTDTVAIGSSSLGGDQTVQVWLDLSEPTGGSPADLIRAHVADHPSTEPLADVAHLRVTAPDDLDRLESTRGALWTPEGRIPLAVTVAPAIAANEADLTRVLDLAACVLVEATGADSQEWTDRLEAAARRAHDAGAAVGVSVHPGVVSPRHRDRPNVEALARTAADAVSIVREATGTTPVLALSAGAGISPVHAVRMAWGCLQEAGQDGAPFVLIDDSPASNQEDTLLEGSARLGGLLADGIGDAIRVDGAPADVALSRTFGVLQATRLRMSRPDYIACPSCGRTLFDLEEVTARIKMVTGHLKGVKIAIMGCIVNGPGEMADADFGYVGSAPGKINLYVKKDCVAKNIPSARAEERLIDLIKDHGMWVEPTAPAATTGPR